MSIAFVQHGFTPANYTTGSSASTAVAFNNPTTAGNCLVACIYLGAISGAPSVTSVTTNGNAENWALGVGNGGEPVSAIYVNPNTGGGQQIIDLNWTFGFTASTSNSVCAMIDIYEFSGLAITNVVDQIGEGLSGDGTTWDADAGTTRLASEVWIGTVGLYVNTSNTTTTITPPGAFTNQTAISGSIQLLGTGTANKYFLYEQSGYQIVSSTGDAAYSGTNGTTAASEAHIVTLKSAPGGTALRPVNVSQAVNRASFY